MKGHIILSGNSLELKLLRESLAERGLKVELKTWEEIKELTKEKAPDLLVIEYRKGESNIELEDLHRIIKKFPGNLVVLAEEISVERAVELIKVGAYDLKLLSSPLEVLEKSILLALEDKRLLLDEERFLTQDPKLLNILRKLEEIGPTDAPILLVGESGTGKELLAKYIHSRSKRKFGPFIAINCAALPETLLESELFGFEKGAFSGATFRKKGKFELAHDGTIFLDEITETSLSFQSKLLRVIQEKEVDRLGGYFPVKVDFRLISSTNQDIEKAVAEGRFRQDLYFRINVITVKIPPLRERKEDVKLLTKYFLEKFSGLYRKKVEDLTEEAWKFLLNYSFPGNVRELKNMIERGVLASEGNLIELKDLLDPLAPEVQLPHPESTFGTKFDLINVEEIIPLERLEMEAIFKALQKTQGNKAKAAELLGITVRTLRNKLKQYEELGLIKKEV